MSTQGYHIIFMRGIQLLRRPSPYIAVLASWAAQAAYWRARLCQGACCVMAASRRGTANAHTQRTPGIGRLPVGYLHASHPACVVHNASLGRREAQTSPITPRALFPGRGRGLGAAGVTGTRVRSSNEHFSHTCSPPRLKLY